ncbi:hypothetical protein GQ607_006167 [Colletotrichum asianum]|uniref:Uncharacterized protein n=1 Tax=Colletotrichum asianum TaxID=702518 RepID=A0A8H3WGE6_9PEZI|nr:hypothetical protein GQ607_006167 [Colletotrichum asianum]
MSSVVVQLTEPQTVVPRWSSTAWLSGPPLQAASVVTAQGRSPSTALSPSPISRSGAHTRSHGRVPCGVDGLGWVGGVGSEPVGHAERRGTVLTRWEGGMEMDAGSATVPWPTGRGDDMTDDEGGRVGLGLGVDVGWLYAVGWHCKDTHLPHSDRNSRWKGRAQQRRPRLKCRNSLGKKSHQTSPELPGEEKRTGTGESVSRDAYSLPSLTGS